MEGQLLILILIMGGIWLVLDEFTGQKRISAFVTGVLGQDG